MLRSRAAALVALLLLAGELRAQETEASPSVTAENGIVIHGVDRRMLAARLRDVDRKIASGDALGAADDLAVLFTGDLSSLIEDGDGAYLIASESALQRVAALDAEALAQFRKIVDPRAETLLAEASLRGRLGDLSRRAAAMAYSSFGPRIFVTLSDLRAARGEARLAARALADLLRLWPDRGTTAEIVGVARAEVVARLGSLCVVLGDPLSLRWLAREASQALLDGPSPATPGATLRQDLARWTEAAARRRDAASPGPTGPLEVVADRVWGREYGMDDGTRSREISEQPLPVGSASRPVLFAREPLNPRTPSKALALAPPTGGGPTLATLWSWPSDEELKVSRRGGRGPFAPARHGDLVIFPWPLAPDALPEGSDRFETSADERNSLVALSLSAEGRLVDERGAFEQGRDDAEPELLTLSFCGRPLVVDDAVYATLVRRTPNTGATELHVARFDIVPDGASHRLLLRWRRHLLDGNAMQPVLYSADRRVEWEEPLAAPTALVERFGRLYVASNTGAVGCLDCEDGAAAWVHTYVRFGPPSRLAVMRTVQKTWKDVPPAVDGPYVWVAPRDAEWLFQFRDMPRSARTTLVQSWRFQGGGGTATEQGPLLSNVVPDEVVAVHEGVGWFSGRRAGTLGADLLPLGSPLAMLRMREADPAEPRRSYAYAQVEEAAASGSPALVPGAILFPTLKAIYRVPLDAFESAPQVLWRPGAAKRGEPPADRIGNLVPDGSRLWSVTPRRVVLFGGK